VLRWTNGPKTYHKINLMTMSVNQAPDAYISEMTINDYDQITCESYTILF